jgi:hypothetical protein
MEHASRVERSTTSSRWPSFSPPRLDELRGELVDAITRIDAQLTADLTFRL